MAQSPCILVGRKNAYDQEPEYYVVVKECGERELEKTEEEISKTTKKAVYIHACTVDDLTFYIAYIHTYLNKTNKQCWHCAEAFVYIWSMCIVTIFVMHTLRWIVRHSSTRTSSMASMRLLLVKVLSKQMVSLEVLTARRSRLELKFPIIPMLYPSI